jgi:O-antigen/teichoic acid export membrane protein
MTERLSPVYERAAARFAATLAANLIRGGLSFGGSIVTARVLGASGYGDLMFLLGSFTAANQLFDMGTSSAFYTLISRRARGPQFFVAYLGWTVFQFATVTLTVGLLCPEKVIGQIWVGQNRSSVLLAFGVSFLVNQAWGTVSQLGEASRKTLGVQAAAIAQAVAHFALVAGLAYKGRLSAAAVLWLLIFEHFVLAAASGPRWIRHRLTVSDAEDDYRAVIREFVQYSKPLAAYAWLGFFYAFADRWMLQRTGGAAEQGFFSVGQQFAAVSLIATTSILKVFWKEIAEATEQGDRRRMERLYSLVSRSLYWTGAWISCLLIPYSREILRWTVGQGYEAAWISMAIMLVFPIHQSLGQTQGAFFYASSETRSYVRIGLVSMAASIPLTYLATAPRSATIGGLELGALGVAIKLVLVQVVQVNVQAYVIARQQGWTYHYSYQAGILAGLLALSWGAKVAASGALAAHGISSPIAVAATGAGLYVLLSLGLLYHSPSIAGLTRADVTRTVRVVKGWRYARAA